MSEQIEKLVRLAVAEIRDPARNADPWRVVHGVIQQAVQQERERLAQLCDDAGCPECRDEIREQGGSHE